VTLFYQYGKTQVKFCFANVAKLKPSICFANMAKLKSNVALQTCQNLSQVLLCQHGRTSINRCFTNMSKFKSRVALQFTSSVSVIVPAIFGWFPAIFLWKKIGQKNQPYLKYGCFFYGINPSQMFVESFCQINFNP